MRNKFRDYEKNPIDIANENDLVELIQIIVGQKLKSNYFNRWSKEALLSEGWIQIQNLLKSWDESKGVPFTKYCFLYLGGRISDGMRSFEEGMHRNWEGKEEGRYIHKMQQFAESDIPHSNECNGASECNNPLDSKETFREQIVNKPSITKHERFIVNQIAQGTTMKTIGVMMDISESMVSRKCRYIRSKINE